MAEHRSRYRLIDLLMIIALCGLVAAIVRAFIVAITPTRPFGSINWLGILPVVGMEVAFVVWYITWKAIRVSRVGPECAQCGRRFLADKKGAGRTVCLRCRQRSGGPSRMRKDHTKNSRILVMLLIVATVAMGLLLSRFAEERFGRAYWIALPLLAVGAMIGLLALLVVAFVIFLRIKARLMQDEGIAIARARKVAGREGRVLHDDPVTYWSSGPTDPVPALSEQLATVRHRFETLFDERDMSRPALRVLAFDKRDALVSYHRQVYSDLWGLDGVYVPAPLRMATLSLEIVPYRITDPMRTARSVFAYHCMDAFKGFLPRPWLQQGIANVLTSGGDRGELARLNRKMMASLSAGTALDAELFRLDARQTMKLVRGWYEQGQFARFAQCLSQSWSFVKYLSGGDAPDDRRRQFRDFVREIQIRQPDEPIFQRHFGYGYDDALHGWKEWVLAQGLGIHTPAPPAVQEALMGRVVPIIRDRHGRTMDRIQAIRDMGRGGHPLGADTLIELLREPGDVPKDEIIWSLQAISGLALGDDAMGWQSWWSDLPDEVTCETIGQRTELSESTGA